MEMIYYLSLFGYLVHAYLALKFLYFLWFMLRTYFLPSLGFVKNLRRYGDWVVVTGATDGIGKQYARQLAKQGFKVVLISRTKEKLEAVAKEIEDEFNVQVKIICFDFTKTTGYEEIEKVLRDLDIGILVNNVAMVNSKGFGKPSTEKDIDEIYDTIHCNIFSDVHLTHMVLKGMVAKQRGAIIHVASCAIYVHLPLVTIYPATKVFMEKFFKSLKLEHNGIIDHQLVTPGFVSSNMSQRKPGFACPSAKEFVSSSICTIGVSDVVCGYFSHELLLAVYSLVPSCISNYFVTKHRESGTKNE